MNTQAMLQIITACIGSLGFAVLFNVRGIRLIAVAVGGLLSWGVYLLSYRYIGNDPICYFLSAAFVTAYAEVMARVLKTPTTVFITSSLIPLVPGGSLYYTMAYAFQSDAQRFVEKAVYTLQLAAALAIGIIIATAFTQLIVRILLFGKEKKI